MKIALHALKNDIKCDNTTRFSETADSFDHQILRKLLDYHPDTILC